MSSNPILYYVPGSPPSRTVLLVARALGLELDLKVIDLANKEQLEPWFLQLNPQHTVPTLVDSDGLVLWDSHAISTYLLGKYSAPYQHAFYPHDLYTRACIDQRMQFNTGVVFPAARGIFFDILFRGATAWTAEAEAAVHEAYGLLETFLASGDFVVGNKMTVADLALVTVITQLATQVPLAEDRYPRTLSWIGRFEVMSYFKEINTDNLVGFVEFFEETLRRNKEQKQH